MKDAGYMIRYTRITYFSEHNYKDIIENYAEKSALFPKAETVVNVENSFQRKCIINFMFDLSTEYAGEILPRVIHVIQTKS